MSNVDKHYILNQIMKPVLQIYGIILEGPEWIQEVEGLLVENV